MAWQVAVGGKQYCSHLLTRHPWSPRSLLKKVIFRLCLICPLCRLGNNWMDAPAWALSLKGAKFRWLRGLRCVYTAPGYWAELLWIQPTAASFYPSVSSKDPESVILLTTPKACAAGVCMSLKPSGWAQENRPVHLVAARILLLTFLNLSLKRVLLPFNWFPFRSKRKLHSLIKN